MSSNLAGSASLIKDLPKWIQVAQHGAGMPVPNCARLLRCQECGARDADFVVSGDGAVNE